MCHFGSYVRTPFFEESEKMLTTIAARRHVSAGSGFVEDNPDAGGPRVLVRDHHGRTVIPELAEPFRVGDFFSTFGANARFSEIDPEFLRIFGNQVIGPRGQLFVARHVIIRRATSEMIAESFDNPCHLDCHSVAELLLRSELLDRGFGGLDDTPMGNEKPRSNIFCLLDEAGEEHWTYLFRVRRSWHLLMPPSSHYDAAPFWGEYGKFFAPDEVALRE